MDLDTWLIYLLAAIGLSLSPGPNGLLAWGGYHRDLQERKIELAKLEAEKTQLRHRSTLLHPRKADPDLADEMVRDKLGLVRPVEVIVPLE